MSAGQIKFVYALAILTIIAVFIGLGFTINLLVYWSIPVFLVISIGIALTNRDTPKWQVD